MISADLGNNWKATSSSLSIRAIWLKKSEVCAKASADQDRDVLLRASIMRGVADAEAGRTAPAGKVFDRLEAKYKAMAQEAERSA